MTAKEYLRMAQVRTYSKPLRLDELIDHYANRDGLAVRRTYNRLARKHGKRRLHALSAYHGYPLSQLCK